MPVPIPLDTTHLDLSSNTMGPLSDSMLTGPGYTTLISLDLSSNHITEVRRQHGWTVGRRIQHMEY
jgi:tsukushi (leucine-rich repeat-containing protein 54)